MTAVDVLWGMGLRVGNNVRHRTGIRRIHRLHQRFAERPSVVKVLQEDQNMAREQEDAAVQAGVA